MQITTEDSRTVRHYITFCVDVRLSSCISLVDANLGALFNYIQNTDLHIIRSKGYFGSAV